MQTGTAGAHFVAGNYVEALRWAEAAVRDRPHYVLANSIIAASAALAGRPAEAHKAIARLRQLVPASRISNLVDLLLMRRPEDFARWVDGLRQAGLPE
jgi:Flp pilus assembly protein TadD